MRARELVAKTDPLTVARDVAAGRVLLGVAFLLAPRRLARPAIRGYGPSDEAVAALRMAAGRDLALGLGALLAARRGPTTLRGWVEGGALADTTDAFVFASTKAFRMPFRVLGALSGALAAAAGVAAARRLGD